MAQFMNSRLRNDIQRTQGSKVSKEQIDRTRRMLDRIKSGQKSPFRLNSSVVDPKTGCTYRLDKDGLDEMVAHLFPSESDDPHIIVRRVGNRLMADYVGDYQANIIDPRDRYPREFELLVQATLYPDKLKTARMGS